MQHFNAQDGNANACRPEIWFSPITQTTIAVSFNYTNLQNVLLPCLNIQINTGRITWKYLKLNHIECLKKRMGFCSISGTDDFFALVIDTQARFCHLQLSVQDPALILQHLQLLIYKWHSVRIVSLLNHNSSSSQLPNSMCTSATPLACLPTVLTVIDTSVNTYTCRPLICECSLTWLRAAD